MQEGEIACVFSVLYNDPIIWKEKDNDTAALKMLIQPTGETFVWAAVADERTLHHAQQKWLPYRPGAIDQDTDGVAGGFGQTHRYRCLERAWIGSTYCMTGLQKRGCGIGHVNLTGGNWGVGSARGRLVLLRCGMKVAGGSTNGRSGPGARLANTSQP